MKSNPNTFANSPLDRAAHLRGDAEALAGLRAGAGARLMLVRDAKPLVAARGRDAAAELAWLRPGLVENLTEGAVEVFLGLEDEVPLFARDASALPDPREGGPLAGLGEFRELRGLLPFLAASEAAMIAQAKALIDWHARHGFCARCGAPTRLAQAGYRRDCAGCQAEHFPRTDPVVIMLGVHGDAALLGRGSTWPAKRYSALAGFLEPGETIEDGVARELFEEAGVRATGVRYLFSQPWPFPSNLMIGCIAEVTARDLTLDPEELADARWFDRAELSDLLAGTRADGVSGPPPFAIAHQLIKAWMG
jgi:NAD+ diphosphatase